MVPNLLELDIIAIFKILNPLFPTKDSINIFGRITVRY